jgi:hypothetical protein
MGPRGHLLKAPDASTMYTGAIIPRHPSSKPTVSSITAVNPKYEGEQVNQTSFLRVPSPSYVAYKRNAYYVSNDSLIDPDESDIHPHIASQSPVQGGAHEVTNGTVPNSLPVKTKNRPPHLELKHTNWPSSRNPRADGHTTNLTHYASMPHLNGDPLPKSAWSPDVDEYDET